MYLSYLDTPHSKISAIWDFTLQAQTPFISNTRLLAITQMNQTKFDEAGHIRINNFIANWVES